MRDMTRSTVERVADQAIPLTQMPGTTRTILAVRGIRERPTTLTKPRMVLAVAVEPEAEVLGEWGMGALLLKFGQRTAQ